NTLAADGSVSLGPTAASHDGRYLAFGLNRAGSDWTEWHVLEVDSGRWLDDHLRWTKFTTAAWTHDGLGFFYMRYPEPRAGEEFEAQNIAPELRYHRLGTPQEQDEVVYARPDEPTWGFAPKVTDDGRFLVITIWSGTDTRTRLACVDLQDRKAGVQPLLMDFDARYDFITNVGDRFYVLTDESAPRGRVIAFDRSAPGKDAWEQIVGEQRDTLQEAAGIAGRLVLTYLRDAAHAVAVHALDGTLERELPLPAPC